MNNRARKAEKNIEIAVQQNCRRNEGWRRELDEAKNPPVGRPRQTTKDKTSTKQVWTKIHKTRQDGGFIKPKNVNQ